VIWLVNRPRRFSASMARNAPAHASQQGIEQRERDGRARDWRVEDTAPHSGRGEAAASVAHLRRRAHVADPLPDTPGRRTFGSVAEEFYRDYVLPKRKHPDDVRRILDNDVLPALGARPLDAITTLDCRDVVKRTVTGVGRLSGRAAPAGSRWSSRSQAEP
jgi:hypothetical protein